MLYISELEKYVRNYSGIISHVSDYTPVIHIKVPVGSALDKNRFRRTLEQKLGFVDFVEESGEVGIL